jgi:hypothetical protein
MPSCPPGTVQVGIISVKGPDGEEGCVICEDCQPPDDPSCPPLNGAGVWRVSATTTERGSTVTRYYAIEIFEPYENSSGQLVEKRIVQSNSAYAGDPITWTPASEGDTFFSLSDRTAVKIEGDAYWDPENCPRTASTNSGRSEVSTWVDGSRASFISQIGQALLRVDCDNNASETYTLAYIGPGEIRDWWSTSALFGTINGGVLVTLTPIPAPDLPGPS